MQQPVVRFWAALPLSAPRRVHALQCNLSCASLQADAHPGSGEDAGTPALPLLLVESKEGPYSPPLRQLLPQQDRFLGEGEFCWVQHGMTAMQHHRSGDRNRRAFGSRTASR